MTKIIDADKVIEWMKPKEGLRFSNISPYDKFRAKFKHALMNGEFDVEKKRIIPIEGKPCGKVSGTQKVTICCGVTFYDNNF